MPRKASLLLLRERTRPLPAASRGDYPPPAMYTRAKDIYAATLDEIRASGLFKNERIIVTPQGDVQNRILVTEREYSPSQLVEAANYINQNFAGLDQEQIRARLQHELASLRDDITGLMHQAVEAGSKALTEESEPFVISGERNLVGIAELSDNMERLRRLFDLFEQKTSLMQLLDASSRAEGVQIFIGGESELVPMDLVSVVLAPYEVDGRIVGTLGVIGPTRMAYERVIPIVDITARLVSSALSQRG